MIYSLHSFSQEKEALQRSIITNDSISNKENSTIFRSLLKLNDSINTSLHNPEPSIFSEVNTLDEVFLKSKSKFNAVSLGILKKEIKPLSINERRLYTAGDFKPIHLLSLFGGSLAVDPIINAISGRTKRLKRYIEIEKKESNLIFLEEHFKGYMIENLHIEEQLIGRFLNFLVENEKLQVLVEREDLGELHFLIGDEWFKFKTLQNDSPQLSIDPIDKKE